MNFYMKLQCKTREKVSFLNISIDTIYSISFQSKLIRHLKCTCTLIWSNFVPAHIN